MDQHSPQISPGADVSHGALLRQSAWIRALALSLVRDAALADDLVQETLLAALHRRPDAGDSLRPWLRRVLRNRWISTRRSAARSRAREEDRARPEELPSGVELLERAEVHGQLVEALARLREPYRSVLLLRFYEELQPGEIARRQGVPAATVRSRLKRGLVELREQLDRRPGGRRGWSLALVPFAVQASPSTLRRSVEPVSRLLAFPLTMKLILLAFAASLAWPLLASPEEPTGEGPGRAQAMLPPVSTPAGSPVLAAASDPARRQVVPAGSDASRDPAAPGSGPAQENGPLFEGTLEHVHTGRPMPHYAFDLQRGRQNERLWTDAEGRFQSTQVWPAGRIRIAYLDHPDLDGSARTATQVLAFGQGLELSMMWDPERAPLALRAVSGPTYPLELSAEDAGVDEAIAQSTARLRATLSAVEDAEHGQLAQAWSFRAPVRRVADERPWARFASLNGVLPATRPWLLRIETEDGLHAGEVQVEPDEDGSVDALEVHLVPRASLDVALVSDERLREPRVALEAADFRAELEGLERIARPDGKHEWRFRATAIPAGTYLVTVRDDGVDEVQDDVALVAGEGVRRTITLAPRPSTTHVRGELRSDSGFFREEVFVRLLDPEGRQTAMDQPRWREVDGRWTAPFTLENLTPGPYRLELSAMRSNRRWTPVARRVLPPREDLVLTCHDEEPTSDVLFQVRDAANGQALNDFTLTTELPECAPAATQVRVGGGKFLFEVADAAALEWFAYAPGYAPAMGDRSALMPDGENLKAVIQLLPGWGARIQAYRQGPDGRQPLPDIELVLDGELAGRTSDAGRLDVSRSVAPTRIELRHSIWRIVGGDFDPATGQLTGAGGTHHVRFDF